MKTEVFRMEKVTYYEKDVQELNNFNLSISKGEILGLIPVNNQGLTAFYNLIRQNKKIKSGYVYYNEKLVNSWQNASSKNNNIAIIQNQSSLVDDLTVFDNVFVLMPSFKSFIINSKNLQKNLKPYFEEIDINIKTDAYVDEISIFERVVVEIIKAVVTGCTLIILSEIASFLSENELEKLYSIIRYYAKKGMSFIYVGYHFEEVNLICSRNAILKNGTISKVLVKDQEPQCSKEYVKSVIDYLAHKEEAEKDVIFKIENLTSKNIHNLCLDIYKGECLAIQVLSNSIYLELFNILCGEKQIEKGKIFSNEYQLQYCRDIAIINEFPHKSMIFEKMSYIDNLCFTTDHKFPEIWMKSDLKNGMLKQIIAEYGVNRLDVPVEYMSDFEKYEIVYNRIILQNPKLVVCMQPFSKADMVLRMHIRKLIQRLIDKGISVLILAVNLADSLSIADRLIRIDLDGNCDTYDRQNFSNIEFIAPWTEIYKE